MAEYLHSAMEPALKNTYGVIVYQEQVMQISKDLCGFTGGQADTLRKGIGKKIPEVMGLKAATIRLLDPTGKKLKLVASYGLSQKYLNRGPVDTEENIIEALNEKPVAIYDVTTDKRIIYQKEAAEEGIKSMLTLPIIARGKILGVLRLLTDKPKNFSQEEIDFAASLAEQCGTAIENATMYEKIKKDYDNIMRYFDNVITEKE